MQFGGWFFFSREAYFSGGLVRGISSSGRATGLQDDYEGNLRKTCFFDLAW